MTKMLIDIDEDALAAAQEIFGAATKKETVNRALAEVTERLRRAAARRELAGLVEDGAIDLEYFTDKENYRPNPKVRDLNTPEAPAA